MKPQLKDLLNREKSFDIRIALHQKINDLVKKQITTHIAEEMSVILNLTKGEFHYALDTQTKINKISFTRSKSL